jgi:ribonuclease T2
MPGAQEILKAFTSSLGLLGVQSPLRPLEDGFSACPKTELSCQTKFDNQDTCCFNYPGGQFLQTQFWDTDPAVGPDDSWTIHGLW